MSQVIVRAERSFDFSQAALEHLDSDLMVPEGKLQVIPEKFQRTLHKNSLHILAIDMGNNTARYKSEKSANNTQAAEHDTPERHSVPVIILQLYKW